MPLETSGTTTWDLPIDEIIEEALEHVGGEHTSGQEARSARRSLNLLLTDMTNRGAPLASLEKVQIPMVVGQRDYTLPQKVVAVLPRAVLSRLNQDGTTRTEIELTKISLMDYLTIPTKSQSGRPVQYTCNRQRDAVEMSVWFTPDNDTDYIEVWCITRIQDVTASHQLVDLPYRFNPAITYGLAYFMANKRDGVPESKVMRLKAEYIELLDRAMEEDRERVDLQLFPCLTDPVNH